MIQILFDIDMPKSCVECPFMVHCDSCESWENRCPILGKKIGYDYNKPYTPRDHRQENCPLKEVVERPLGEWIDTDVTYEDTGDVERRCSNCKHGDRQSPSAIVPYCWYCGADMRKRGE